MPRYLIVRSFEVGESDMPAVGRRSREIVVDDTGNVRTFCVYAAPSEEIVREHSSRLGRHRIDSIDEIVGDVTPSDFPAA
jgi:hypothetical protein